MLELEEEWMRINILGIKSGGGGFFSKLSGAALLQRGKPILFAFSLMTTRCAC